MQNQKHKRYLKNYIINPGYQFRYIFWLTSSGVVLVGINAWIAYMYIRENYMMLVDLSPMTEEAKAQLYAELRHLILAIGSSSFLFLVVISVLGIVLSHRTAGPLYAFKRVFDEISKGNLNRRLKLRPGDEFQEVAESFNQMMDSVTKPKS